MARKSKKQRKAKAKRREFIARISRDGKISKKEGKKAAERGISLRSIQNRNIGAYRDAVRSYGKGPGTSQGRIAPGASAGPRPTFSPLKIKRGAEQALRIDKTATPEAQVDTFTPPAETETATETAPVETGPTMQEMFDNFTSSMPDYGAMIAASTAENAKTVQSLIDSNQAAAQQRASEYEAQLTRMREEQAAAQLEYQRQAAEQQKQFELAQRTSLGNQARAGQQANYQLGGAAGMRRGGTFGFRRRRRQLMGGIGASGLAGATASANTGGTLNV